MRSHGRGNKRNRGHKVHDDQLSSEMRLVEDGPEVYTRPHQVLHRGDNYKTPSTSNRTPYDNTREASTSRGHTETETWRRADSIPERYTYDGYRRGGEDYEISEARDSETWSNRPTHDSQYSRPRDDWTQRYDQRYPSSSHPDSAWNTPTPGPYYRTPNYEYWTVKDGQSPRRDTPLTISPEEGAPERDGPGWRRDQRRDKNGQKFLSDSGWGTRRRGKGINDSNRRDTGPIENERRGSIDERSWEPASTWRPNNRNEPQQRAPSGQWTSPANKHRGKRVQNSTKAKRDWRNDDGSLNNWPKRDSRNSPSKYTQVPTRRKHPRSSSRSRSRSPAESYYSRPSSRGRSRSRSASPAFKRPRQDSSPVAGRSRTPSDRGRTNWIHHDRPRSRSPRRTPESHGPRRRSVSSVSSVSTDRSPSLSPANRPRAVHRLPPVSITSPNVLIPVGNHTGGRKSGRNGKNHGKRDLYRQNSTATAHAANTQSMPPPVIIPPTHDFRPIYTPSEVPPPTPPSSGPRVEVSKSIARAATRVAGFKPIGTSSSLKKFFPGDDDDVDPVAANQGGRRQSPAAPVPPRYDAVNPQDRSITTNPPVANGDEPRWGSPDGYRNRDSHPPQNLNARVTPPHIQSQQPPLPTLADLRLQVQADEVEAKPRHDETVTANTEALSLVPKELYAIVSQVGEGTFGKVYKAQNTVTKVHLALKRIRMESEKDGFPVTAMREIKLLQSLRHENVVRLYEMMVSNGSVYMVFEYMDHDLTGVLSQTQFNFTDAHLKSLCHQMLAGLAYLHHKGVIHRDIKGSNILINNRGELKLADFGLARFYQKRRRMDYTNRVITLWYRPPELLFGATVYGPEVDMWSAGCIMLELFTKKPVFQGNDEIHQLDVVYKILGTPNPDRWASIMHLPWYELIKPRESIPNRFRELFQKWMSPAALDLAEELLAYNPAERITALQAMNTPYFTVEEPDAARPVGLATLEGEWHELETKRERAKKRRKIDTVIP